MVCCKFEITAGCNIVAQFPEELVQNPDYGSSFIIPKGLHRHNWEKLQTHEGMGLQKT
uniref:Uncharacterized protein n=1 Tax=Physcomitrium patens TaxID=3218 RepID=A0A2K1JL74_PHYPA|nr:hypothetical protein PHYPA_017139 [Physcomitrium patens]